MFKSYRRYLLLTTTTAVCFATLENVQAEEINALDYLNSNVSGFSSDFSWSDTSSGAVGMVQIGGKDYYYDWVDMNRDLEMDNRVRSASDSLEKDFVGLKYSDGNSGLGGAVSLQGYTLSLLSGDFIGNSLSGSEARGSAIYLNGKSNITKIIGQFIGNTSSSKGDTYGSISLASNATVGSLTGNFIGNSAHTTSSSASAWGGAIHNGGTMNRIENSNFLYNSVTGGANAYGGAIYNKLSGMEIVNSNFYYNSASDSSNSKGGAIYSANNLTIKADNGTSTFSGNTAAGTPNDVYMEKGTLDLYAIHNGEITFNSGIDGGGYTISVDGDKTGSVNINGMIGGKPNLSVANATLNLSMQDGTYQTLDLGTLTVSSGKLALSLDANLATGESDSIVASTIASGTKLDLNYVRILGDGNKTIKIINTNSKIFRDLEEFEASSALGGYTFVEYEAGVLTPVKTGPKSLDELVKSTALSKKEYMVTGTEGDVSYNLGIMYGQSLVILGHTDEDGNKIVLDGRGFEGMNTGAGQTVEVSDTKVYNFVRDDQKHVTGGFIENAGEAKFENVDFVSNRAAEVGGAIHNTNGGDISLISGSFNENKAYDDTRYYAKAQGGAIYNNNQSIIEKIQADFTQNQSYVEANSETSYADGGAIHNDGTIGAVTGKFELNSAESPNVAYGGAVYNTAEKEGVIADIEGDFVQNSATAENAVWGGAIYNDGTIGTEVAGLDRVAGLKGTFDGNTVFSLSSSFGGAVANYGTISNIDGAFKNNEAEGVWVYGGAIHNSGTIGSEDEEGNTLGRLKADFTGNIAQTDDDYGESYGGAIYNDGVIYAIDGDFSDNKALYGEAYGGAIYNDGLILEINGDFTSNKAVTSENFSSGGAIYNALDGSISEINGDFNKNNVEGYFGLGAAIYNEGSIDTISGDFEENIITAEDEGYGAAIYNTGTIGSIINSNFTNNKINGVDTSKGGAIYSEADLKIVADNESSTFSGNMAGNVANDIYMNGATLDLVAQNKGVITFGSGIDGSRYDINVSGDKTGIVNFNSLIKGSPDLMIENATVNLNLQDGTYASVDLGILSVTTGTLNFDFDSNLLTGETDLINAGLVDENTRITLNTMKIYGDGRQDLTLVKGAENYVFANLDNFAAFTVGYKYTFKEDKFGILSVDQKEALSLNAAVVDPTEQKSYTIAGVESNQKDVIDDLGTMEGKTLDILGSIDEDGNKITLDGRGFAGMNTAEGQTVRMDKAVVTNFETEGNGGFINNSGEAGFENVEFRGNKAANGGAVYNAESGEAKFVNTSFKNNEASGKGGAIYGLGKVTLVATGEDQESVISGNTANGSSNGVYMESGTLGLKATQGGKVSIQDEIDGESYELVIEGDETGVVELSSAIKNASKVSTSDVTTNIEADQSGLNLEANSGILNVNANLADSKVLVSGATTNIETDQDGLELSVQSGVVNLNTKLTNSALKLSEEETSLARDISNGAEVNVTDFSQLHGNNRIEISGGKLNVGTLKDNVHLSKLDLSGGEINISNVDVDLAGQKMGSLTADEYHVDEGKVHVHDVTLHTDSDAAETRMQFTETDASSNVINHVVEGTAPVFKYQIGYDDARGEFIFRRTQDVNPEVNAPAVASAATLTAINDEIYSRVLSDADREVRKTQLGVNRDFKNAWAKGFGSKDHLNMRNMDGFESETYGVIGGLSTDRISEGKGWESIGYIYGAYMGGKQEYESEKVREKGGYLGLGFNLYHGDYFIGVTGTAGYVRHSRDESGSAREDNYYSYTFGGAVKTGYDWHVGSYTITPSVYGSYTYITSEDYETERGAQVKFGNMGLLEAVPELKVAKDFGENFSAYIKARYVMTWTTGNRAKANGYVLPDVELQDYAEYGIGMEKKTSDNSKSGFLEILRRDGGKEGWHILGGIKIHF